ncbi:MAG: stage 0 sporulation family protein, partial [Clostridia bacterium]|nr:stage 0 sporulation family protein [Clostridia bacterium]
LRKATDADKKRMEENRKKEAEALKVCEQKIEKHGLDMKLVDVDYTLDGSKILFYFTADGRVDFRELVKDLAGVFRTRIELRQIGVRDEAKMLGGLGMCGRPFCCNSFMGDFQPVSIKMAKEQGLSLNPVKISGTCGRLMCCLKYEQEAYEHLLRVTPKAGAIVQTREGKGVVSDVNLLTGMLKVSLDRNPDAAPISVNRHDVTVIKDGKIKIDRAEMEALKGIE